MFKYRVISLGIFLAVILGSCRDSRVEKTSSPPAPESELILRDDNLAFYQLFADQFNQLTLQQKRYAYHLYRACWFGRDIYFDQHAPHSLSIRRQLDYIMKNRHSDDEFQRQVRKYALRFGAFNGNYDPKTSRKFVPLFSSADWMKEALQLPGAESISSLKFQDEEGFLFNAECEPQLVNKSPAGGGDPLLNSAVNFYAPDITYPEAEAFNYTYALNGRLAKSEGQIVEEVYRVGAPDITPGRMSENIKCIISELESAVAFATQESQRALTKLIRYLQTGDSADFYRYCQLWTRDNSSPVDYILGFIEVYHDPLGRRGSFEGLVMVEDKAASAAIQALARNAAWFEARMPWAEEYKKVEFTLPTARAFQLILGIGDGGPQCPSGINLPNDQSLRETVGTKNFLLTNVMSSGAEERTRKLYEEFLPTPEERAQALLCLREQSRAMVAMHEVIGHGSGRKDPRLEGDPALLLKEYGSTLEEARATLAALWFIGDPHLVELGVVPSELTREGVYRGLLAGALIALQDYPEGSQIENDHGRAGHLISNYILANGGAELSAIKNKRYLLLTDVDQTHQAVGDLLAEIQRIKAVGDFSGAKKLVETYGIRFDPGLRDEVLNRIKPLDLPNRKAFIMPELELERNKMGGVTDVKIIYPRDMIKQMIKFGELTEDLAAQH